MDIERLIPIGSFPDTRPKKKKYTEKGESEKTRRTGFSNALEKAADFEATRTLSDFGPLPELDGTETVEVLLDEVHEAGEALKRDPVFGPLNGYKTAVRRFLRYVLDNALETGEILGIRNPETMLQKKYIAVRVVDEKLESLAAHVLKGQADQLDILRRIDEINGLLVDLSV